MDAHSLQCLARRARSCHLKQTLLKLVTHCLWTSPKRRNACSIGVQENHPSLSDLMKAKASISGGPSSIILAGNVLSLLSTRHRNASWSKLKPFPSPASTVCHSLPTCNYRASASIYSSTHHILRHSVTLLSSCEDSKRGFCCGLQPGPSFTSAKCATYFRQPDDLTSS